MKLLLNRNSYEDLRAALGQRPDVDALIMEGDGSVVDTAGAAADAATAEAAWLSSNFFLNPQMPLRPFLAAVTSSSEMKWVQSGAAGYEHPIFQRILDAGVRLTINDGSSVAIAEYVMAQVLACFHPGPERIAAQRQHEWTTLPFRELSGTRWVILGYGSIGRHVAARAKAFGASVVGIRRTPREDMHADRVVGVDSLAQEAATADVLLICAAANDSNAKIIDAKLLATMKPDAVLVNVARGSLVDEPALMAALDAGRPGHAVLDVFDTEPLPAASPLWDHPKVSITAHCAPAANGTRARGQEVFLEHLDAWRAGKPLRLEVDS